MSNVEKNRILRILKNNKDNLTHDYGLLKLGVFGSVARNDAKEGSDVDIVVETKVPDLLRMVNLKEDLEALLHSKVDLIRYRFRMNALLKKRIDKEAYYV
ncbi:MAG: nucleotidyltransferase domain-containing protein [Thermodesulfobacteriota bacterium]|nr:nucleotidyltransferase domain-containing protein [Thermodesulfobacteriota bacterium]